MNAETLAENVINRLELRVNSLYKMSDELDESVPSLGGAKTHIQGKQDGLREAIAYIKEELY